MQTREEVDNLKRHWTAEPEWNIEETGGFEEYRDELLAFRQEMEAEWDEQKQERTRQRMKAQWERARELGCSVSLVAHLESLEERITELVGRLEDVESELWWRTQETMRHKDQLERAERKIRYLQREIE